MCNTGWTTIRIFLSLLVISTLKSDYLLVLAQLKQDPNDEQLLLNSADGIEMCLYQNKAYPPGALFQPDHCTNCHCPPKGGNSICHVKNCVQLPNCLRYGDIEEGYCCPRCLEFGCLHKNGTVYQHGTIFQDGPCETCSCSLDGVHTVCKSQHCPIAQCVDGSHIPGQCCPVCPNGPNCRHGGKIIPASRREKVDRCTVCQCPNPLRTADKAATEAVCWVNCEDDVDDLRDEAPVIQLSSHLRTKHHKQGTGKHRQGNSRKGHLPKTPRPQDDEDDTVK